MQIILFRSKLTPEAGADYDAMDAELQSLVRGNPGFIRAKSYIAQDGERLTVVWWRDEESLREWRNLARHREAQNTGRQRWYRYYEMEVATVTRTQSFGREHSDATAGEQEVRPDGPLSPLINELRRFPNYLRTAARGMSASDLQYTPAKGGFSLVEHACHLRDYEETGCLGRMQRMLTEQAPFLADFEGERLALERNYRAQDFSAAVDDFARYRRTTLEMLQALSNEQLERTATLGNMGVVSIPRLVAIVREHDRTHQQEIENLLGEIRLHV